MTTWQPLTDATSTPPEGDEALDAATSSGSEPAWPELTGDQAAFADASDATPSRTGKLGEGMIVLGVVLAVAAGALWVMRASGAVNVTEPASAIELKIEQALAQMTGQSMPAASDDLGTWINDSDSLIQRFNDDGTEKQVPLNDLVRNPFALARGKPTAEAGPTAAVDPEAQRRQQRVRDLRNELQGLELQTVMSGRSPLAVISGQVVREGQTLGSFTIASIEPRTAILTAEGNTYRLSMNQPSFGGAAAHD